MSKFLLSLSRVAVPVLVAVAAIVAEYEELEVIELKEDNDDYL